MIAARRLAPPAISLLLAGAAVAALAAQTRPAPPATAPAPAPRGSAAHGREIYESSGCALCHATSASEEEKQGMIRAGHPLEGAAFRGTWWQGRIVTDAADASEHCLKTWIAPDAAGFTAPERKALVLFLQSLGDSRGVGPLQILRRDAGDVDLSAGDAARGKGLYDAACLSCHPGGAPAAKSLAGSLSPAELASVIRRGVKTMPFFQVDRLTATQVADIAVYLEALRAGPPPR